MRNAIEFKNKLDNNVFEFIDYLIGKGGPEPQDYCEFTAIVNNLDSAEIDDFRERIKTILNDNTLIGHGFVKPFGYPGDFTLIDKIYNLILMRIQSTGTGISSFRINPGQKLSGTGRISF